MVINKEKISIVVRTTGFNKKFLERAIFSIYCSEYQNKEVILVYQGNDLEFVNYLNYIKNLYYDIEFIIIHNNNELSDDRAKNLNLGIENATGRYIAFLDDDDTVSQEHYQELISQIKIENFVWGYANCCLNNYRENYLHKKTHPYNKKYSFDRLLEDNFIPIHSFVIDLSKISDRSIIKTNTSLVRLEDYYILLNLASRYMPIIVKTIGVFYNFYPKKDEKEEGEQYEKSKEIIKILKKKIELRNNQNVNFKNNKLKIFYQILMLLIYHIPFIGNKIIKYKKAMKFVNFIYLSLKTKNNN